MSQSSTIAIWDTNADDPRALTLRTEDKARYDRLMQLVKDAIRQMMEIESEAVNAKHYGTAKWAGEFSDALLRSLKRAGQAYH